MTPAGMITVFGLLLVCGILLCCAGGWVPGGLLLLGSLAMACWIGKEIAEANDPSNNSK